MKTIHFLAGLPRSGSTVLASILNQHPDVYVTPTSPLLDQLINNQDVWHQCLAVKAHPVPDQLTNITRRLINAIWSHIDKPVIIDKNRGWQSNMPASTILFEKEIKIVATVRDIPSIMASWMTLLRANPNSYMDKVLMEKGVEVNDWNRMDEMWNHMVLDCVKGVEKVKKEAGNRLLLVDYDELVEKPIDILGNIEKFLGLNEHKYNLNEIINTHIDDDLSAWGLQGMHTIREQLKKTSKSAEEILGVDLYQYFLDIQTRITNGKF